METGVGDTVSRPRIQIQPKSSFAKPCSLAVKSVLIPYNDFASVYSGLDASQSRFDKGVIMLAWMFAGFTFRREYIAE